jgi:hypothetical protein
MTIKALVKQCLRAVSPRAAIALESARSRSHSHRVIAGWGCGAVNESLIERFGDRVTGGPFQGMTLTPMTRREQLGPYLLGLYEQELHPVWERLFRNSFPQIVDVGAKFGYYAVGFARQFPESRVVAFDTDHWARHALREMVAANRVSNVEVRSFCDPGWLAANLRDGALVVSDCEGFEGHLFASRPIPALSTATLVIETHDVFVPGTVSRLKSALALTHEIETIPSGASERDALPDLGFLNERERDLATQEVRPPQLYLVCTPKSGPSAG